MKFLRFIIVFLFSILISPTTPFCPAPYCSCNDSLLTVTCDHHDHTKSANSLLRVVPIFLNPRIRSLNLPNNQIKDITLSLQFYQELVHLDLSGNEIGSLGTQNFESLKSLEHLNVSYNHIKVLDDSPGVFQGLGGSLKVLDLGGNVIERVAGEAKVFSGLRNLRELILERNRLESLNWEVLKGLEKLERVRFAYNFIQVLESHQDQVESHQSSWTLENLHHLDISSNQLTRVKASALLPFPNLVELNLCCNYIHTLEDGAFTGLSSLSTLNLSQNRLLMIPPTVFDPLSSLRSLDFSSNRLRSMSPLAFRSLTHLETLRISDNPNLVSIPYQTFTEQVNLVTFEADYLPNLTEFHANLLENKPRLERFSLRFAQITGVPEDLVNMGGDIGRSLDLTGNPIDCSNCTVWGLYEYLNEGGGDHHHHHEGPSVSEVKSDYYVDNSINKKIIKKRKQDHLRTTVRCAGPEGLRGIFVKDLKQSDFHQCFFISTKDDLFFVMCAVGGGVGIVLISLMIVGGVKVYRRRRSKKDSKDWMDREEDQDTKCSDGNSGNSGGRIMVEKEQILTGQQTIPGRKLLFIPADSLNSSPSHPLYNNPPLTNNPNNPFHPQQTQQLLFYPQQSNDYSPSYQYHQTLTSTQGRIRPPPPPPPPPAPHQMFLPYNTFSNNPARNMNNYYYEDEGEDEEEEENEYTNPMEFMHHQHQHHHQGSRARTMSTMGGNEKNNRRNKKRNSKGNNVNVPSVLV